MARQFSPLSHLKLSTPVDYLRPPELPGYVQMTNPATDVMTDFHHVRPRTITADVAIDEALEHMKSTGVRLLLVTDQRDQIIGLVTSYDIQGEAPVKLQHESRLPRAQISLDQIMTRAPAIEMVNMLSVRNAQVGHIVATLHALELKHLLVFERNIDVAASSGEESSPFSTKPWAHESPPPPPAAEQRIRGLFSAAQISRQLRVDIDEVMTAAHSLLEIQHELNQPPG